MAEDSETKHGGNKNGKKEGVSGSSFFTWFMVIALLGVWTSVAVVWFELVDYEEVLGKLGIYDADGDGDFDVEDAKVLLGLKERSVPAQPAPAESEESIQPAEKLFVKSEHKNVEAELEEEIQAILHEALHSQAGEGHEEGADDGLNDEHEEGVDERVDDEQPEKDEVHEEAFEIPTTDDLYGALEDEIPEVPEKPKSVQEETDSHVQVEEHGVGEPETAEIRDPYEYYMDVDEPAYEPKVPDNKKSAHEDALEHPEEPNYGGGAETLDTVYAELETGKTEETAGKEPVNEHYYEESVQEPADDAEKEDEREVPESVNEDTEPEEKEHTEDTVAAEPQKTEVPVEAENYSNDDLVDT